MIAHCTRLIRILACVVLATPIRTAAAQSDTTAGTPTTTSTRSTCWRPRPAPACRKYVPTEFSFEYPIASTTIAVEDYEKDDFRGRFVLSLGLMKNRGATDAFGGLVSIATQYRDGIGPLRAEGRYRRWIGDGTGVDFGLGVAQRWVDTESGAPDVRARGLTAGIGLDVGYAGIDARVDALRGGGRTRSGAFVGVHAGAQAGPTAAAVVAITAVLAVIAILSTIDY